MSAKKITRYGIVIALYYVLSVMVPAMTYGPIQFRFSEAMTLLAFVNPGYVLPLTVACALVNLSSPFGIIDVIFGTLATFLALYSMTKTKNLYIASLFPTIFSIIIGLEILFLSAEPINFFLVTGQILLSQFIIVSLIGVSLYKLVEKNSYLVELIKDIPEK